MKSAKRVWIVFLVVGFYLVWCMAAWAAEINVSSSMQVNKGRLFYDFKNKQNFIDVTLQNRSSRSFYPILKLVISSISTAEITLANPDGKTADGMPYVNFSNAVGDRVCSPSEVSSPLALRFNNPKQLRFTFTTMVLAGDTPTQQTTRTVGPEGGTLEFHNGIVLQVPGGAVDAETQIIITDIFCEESNSIFAKRQYISHTKRCIGGFSAEPKGLRFNVPVKAIYPVLALEPNEIPIQVDIDFENTEYFNVPTELLYTKDSSTVEIEIRNFSAPSAMAVKVNPKKLARPTNCDPNYEISDTEYENLMDEICRSCATYMLPEYAQYCACLANTQSHPPCCWLPPRQRENWAPQCDCCREKKIRVRADGIDFTRGICQILGDQVILSYPECPNNPTETVSLSEISRDCPQDMKFTITIRNAPTYLPVCTNALLKAEIKGSTPDGKIIYDPMPFYPFWGSDHEDLINFLRPDSASNIIDGTVRALKESETEVVIWASAGDIDQVTPGVTPIVPICHVCSLTLNAQQSETNIGSFVPIAAYGVGKDGNTFGVENIKWTTSNIEIGYVIPTEGGMTFFVGNMPGLATITASYHDECEERIATTTIEVKSPEANELVVLGKIGDCPWNAPYCEYPSASADIPVTVRVGVFSEGEILWKPNIEVFITGYIPGYSEELVVYPVDGGLTNDFGEHTSFVTPKGTVPYIALDISCSIGSTIKHIDLRAITKDFCNTSPNPVFGPPFGNDVYDLLPIHSRPTIQLSMGPTDFSCFVMPVEYCNIISVYPGWFCYGEHILRNEFYWDTLLIMPLDLSQLGKPIDSVLATVVGVASSDGEVSGNCACIGASAFYSVGLNYSSPSQFIASAWYMSGISVYGDIWDDHVDSIAPSMVSLYPLPNQKIGMPMPIIFQGTVNAGFCGNFPCAGHNGRAFALVSGSFIQISDVNEKSTGHSIGPFNITSCSGIRYR